MSFAPPKVLIIAGMHRSGTSLAAALLQSAGVAIGDRLMGPAAGNLKGHYENLDFVNFHSQVLQAQGRSGDGWTCETVQALTPQQIEQAQAVVESNMASPIWGWKDPRTTLFLDFWADFLPEAHFLLMFRSPWEVVDSLLRRSPYFGDIFLDQPDLAIQFWLHYNRHVLDFLQRWPERCLLVNVGTLATTIDGIIGQLNTRLGTSLVRPQSEIYDAQLLTKTGSKNSYQPCLIQHFYPNAIALYETLLTREAEMLDTSPDLLYQAQLSTAADSSWIFQNWLSLAQCKFDKVKLEETKSELQTGVEILQVKLQEAETNAQNILNTLESERQKFGEAIVILEHQAEIYQARINTLEAQIEAIKSSKFWKVRRAWVQLRRKLGLSGEDLSDRL